MKKYLELNIFFVWKKDAITWILESQSREEQHLIKYNVEDDECDRWLNKSTVILYFTGNSISFFK